MQKPALFFDNCPCPWQVAFVRKRGDASCLRNTVHVPWDPISGQLARKSRIAHAVAYPQAGEPERLCQRSQDHEVVEFLYPAHDAVGVRVVDELDKAFVEQD